MAQHAQWLRSDALYPGTGETWWQCIQHRKVVAALVVVGGDIAGAIIFAGNIASALSAIRKFLAGGE